MSDEVPRHHSDVRNGFLMLVAINIGMHSLHIMYWVTHKGYNVGWFQWSIFWYMLLYLT